MYVYVFVCVHEEMVCVHVCGSQKSASPTVLLNSLQVTLLFEAESLIGPEPLTEQGWQTREPQQSMPPAH